MLLSLRKITNSTIFVVVQLLVLLGKSTAVIVILGFLVLGESGNFRVFVVLLQLLVLRGKGTVFIQLIGGNGGSKGFILTHLLILDIMCISILSKLLP